MKNCLLIIALVLVSNVLGQTPPPDLPDLLECFAVRDFWHLPKFYILLLLLTHLNLFPACFWRSRLFWFRRRCWMASRFGSNCHKSSSTATAMRWNAKGHPNPGTCTSSLHGHLECHFPHRISETFVPFKSNRSSHGSESAWTCSTLLRRTWTRHRQTLPKNFEKCFLNKQDFIFHIFSAIFPPILSCNTQNPLTVSFPHSVRSSVESWSWSCRDVGKIHANRESIKFRMNLAD